MRSYFLRALLFVVPLFVLLGAFEWAVRWGAMRCNVDSTGKINLIMQHRSNPEIAIFGGSNAAVEFNAPLIEAQTGLKTFDFGLNGTMFNQYRPLVEEYATYARPGSYVVIAETFLTFYSGKTIASPQFYLPYVHQRAWYEAFRSIDSAAAWRLNYVPFYTLIFANQEYYRASLFGYRTLSGWQPPSLDKQGFIAIDEAWDPSVTVNETWRTAYVKADWIAPLYVDTVHRMAQRGLKVVIAMMPIAEPCWQRVPGLFAHRDRIRSLVGADVVFLDYLESPLARDTANFYNCSHLNARGAAAFSTQFSHDLMARARR